MSLFYKSQTGWAADFIPFYKDGVYYLFYLEDYRDITKMGEGTPWYLLTTTDFVNFKEYGEVIPRGTQNEQDLYVFTGSVMEDTQNVSGHKYHIYYTGHNPHFIKMGKPQEAVMHCVSDDLIHWTKCPNEMYFAPPQYEPDDWRDPFVYYDENAGEYRMLTAARFPDGPSRYRGFTAMSGSKDLVNWELREPMYTSREYFTNECPDYFKWGDYYYLIFSEFTGEHRTHYRVSKSPYGPWQVPSDEFFDTRSFYAAKSWSDGSRRFIFGWNPTRVGLTDSGGWMWGSHLVVHELKQRADGSLYVAIPEAVDSYFANGKQVKVTATFGDIKDDGKITLDGKKSRAMCLTGEMPAAFKLEAELEFDADTTFFGILLHASDDMEQSYQLRIEPRNGRLVFDKWPKMVWDVPYMPESERRFAPCGSKVKLTVFVEDTQVLAYLSDEGNTVALSTRMYDLKGKSFGLFAQNGVVTVDAKLFVR